MWPGTTKPNKLFHDEITAFVSKAFARCGPVPPHSSSLSSSNSATSDKGPRLRRCMSNVNFWGESGTDKIFVAEVNWKAYSRPNNAPRPNR